SFGNVKYRTLTWSNGTPTLSVTQTVVTAGYGGSPLPAPALGSTTAIDTADDRLQSAVIRNHQLWTARNEGLDSTGNSTATAERSYSELDPGTNRWGDYSCSSVDPNDSMTAWTIQEYASNVNPSADRWGTWVQSFAAPAPTLNNPAGSGTQGQTGVTLNLTGT